MHYALEPGDGRFTVQAFAEGMLSGFGHSPIFAIRGYTSELVFAVEAPAEASFRMTVKAASLAVTGSVSAKDREEIERQMRQDVLDVAAYPEIVHQSTNITADMIADNWYRVKLAGELALHGVKKPQPVEAQLRLSDDQARLSGQATLLTSAYGIKRVTALAGMIRLKDELKFDFDLACRKQDQ